MRDLQCDVAGMAEADLLSVNQRIKLNKMTQSPGSNIRTFLANLRGQASLCQYKAECKESGIYAQPKFNTKCSFNIAY